MDLGGAQQAVLALLQGLEPAAFEQIIITGQGGLLFEELAKLPGVRHYVVPHLNRHIGPRSVWADLKALWQIRGILRAERPLIAHTHTPKAGIIGRWAAHLAGVPIVLHTYHGFGFGDSHASWRRWLYVSIERSTARITSRLVAVSEQNRSKAEAMGMFKQGRCDVIRSGISFPQFQLQTFDKVQKKMELGLSPTDRIVGIVASFTPAKGLQYFLDAAAQIRASSPGVRFLMVGDGELRPQLESRMRQLQMGQALQMLGWRRDVPELLRIFDVLMLTSLWEGVPRVLVEAALAGVPVVASNVDGVAEVVQDGRTGILVPPGDAHAAAQAVIELLSDETRRKSMGSVGQSTVTEFSVERMLDAHLKLYRQLAGPQPLSG